MKNRMLRAVSKVMCLVLIATFAFEMPAIAAFESIKVNVGGQSVQVTPGQWVSVRRGGQVTDYNVRYVNGQAVAFEKNQYLGLIFGSVASSLKAGTPAAAPIVTTPAPGVSFADSRYSPNPQYKPRSETYSPNPQYKPRSEVYSPNLRYSRTPNADIIAAQEAFNKSHYADKTSMDAYIGGKSAGSRVSFADSHYTAGEIADYNLTGRYHRNSPPTIDEMNIGGALEKTGTSYTYGELMDYLQTGRYRRNSPPTSDALMVAKKYAKDHPSAQFADSQGASGDKGAQAGESTQSGQFAQASAESMTSQGFQNVKNSLKSGFTARNILVTAGITAGVDLATQIVRGQKPSLMKAVKTVASAEFAGGVVGAVTGAAAGSFAVPFLTAIPVVGGVLSALAPTIGSIAGGSMGSYLAGDIKNGRFSIREAFKRISWIDVGGQAVGSTIGAMLGSMILPPFGTIVGGIAGGYIGSWAAQKIASLIGKGTATPGRTPSVPGGTNEVTIGEGFSGGAEISVSGNQQGAGVLPANVKSNGTSTSDRQLARAKYQKLYQLYNEVLAQGRKGDAEKIAMEMNKAKAEFETLRSK